MPEQNSEHPLRAFAQPSRASGSSETSPQIHFLSESGNVNFVELFVCAHERDYTSLALRQSMILDLLLALNEKHGTILENAALLSGEDPLHLAKGLCVKGSATLPPSLRRANDLDFTVDIGFGYRPDSLRASLLRLFEIACTKAWPGGWEIHAANLENPVFSERVKELKTDKLLSVFLITRTVSIEESQRMRARLESLFDYSDKDARAFDTFNPESIARIVDSRRTNAQRHGVEYHPSPIEKAGAGLRIVLRVEVSTLDNLNLFAPFRMGFEEGKFHSTFHQRTGPRESHLSFANPAEEVAGKLFAILTNHDRAIQAEPHARDLVDLYLRTALESPDRAFAPFRTTNDNQDSLAIKLLWPAHPAFYEGGLHFKHVDPAQGRNLKQVRKGLELGFERGVFSQKISGTPLSTEAIDAFALRLLNHTWSLCEASFGVRRKGTSNQPEYSICPEPPVAKMWDFCRRTRQLFAASRLSETAANAMAQRAMKKLIVLLRPIAPPDWTIGTLNTASINCICQADSMHSRKWPGIITPSNSLVSRDP